MEGDDLVHGSLGYRIICYFLSITRISSTSYVGEDKMNEQTRKALTLYLGECWHDIGHMRNALDCNNHDELNQWSERDKTVVRNYFNNRDFTTPDDADALRRKMVEKGDCGKFIIFTITKWRSGQYLDDWTPCTPDIINYLMENFNELAGEWIEGRKG